MKKFFKLSIIMGCIIFSLTFLLSSNFNNVKFVTHPKLLNTFPNDVFEEY